MKKTVISTIAVAAALVASAEIKVGVIGCDTSHTLAFTKIMNVEKPEFAKDFRMVAAYQYGSVDIASSTNRYVTYIPKMEAMGVKMVGSIKELLDQVDCVCLETCDGRPHPAQAEEVFKSGKLVFIDKPIGENFASARKIYELGKKYNAKYFSSSALRYSDAQQDCRNGKYGKIQGAFYYAPSPVEEQGTHGRYTWYGIHGFEPLFTVMGTGAKTVRTVSNGRVDIVTIKWNDGRVGTLRLNQNAWVYGGFAFYDNAKEPAKLEGYKGYQKLLEHICQFFKDGIVPVPNDETLEIFAAMEAAERSYLQGGREVTIAEIME